MELVINGNSLSGSMPASISEMDGLIVLTLSDTILSGSMPASIGILSNLRHLLYMTTLFSGEAIPEHSVLTRRSVCDLFCLAGTIPEQHGHMTSLRTLILSCSDSQGHIDDADSQGLSGSLPRWFKNMTHIIALELSHCNLHGDMENFRPSSTTNIHLLRCCSSRALDSPLLDVAG